MEYLIKALGQVRTRVWLASSTLQILIGLVCLWLYDQGIISFVATVILFTVSSIISGLFIGRFAGQLLGAPLKALGDAIMHISPSESARAPETDKLRIGREYVNSLIYQLYQVASLQDNKLLAEHKREATQASNILSRLPIPVLVFNKDQLITFGTDVALDYCGLKSDQLFGKPVFEAADLEFPSDFTLESWTKDCQQNKVTDTAYWRRVRLRLKDGTIKQCDMAGYYNRDNPKGVEFIITLFDKTEEYAQDDQAMSFTALAVHELRTPLTIMRGYIEVLEDELDGKLDAEMTEFMHRLKGAAQQLSSFVSNILNVARIDANQMVVKPNEEKWSEIIQQAGSDMEQRSNALGMTIQYEIEPGLPTVGVDRMTIYEVICNLIDNALKYSGKSKSITLKSYKTKDGLVETVIQDYGGGIPTSVLPLLFEKFHRNHRNRSQISGTGLGLYLSKVIVNAHGGDIWVKSKEGEGTTVGFTIKPYAMLADELKKGDNKDDMVRTAHGWIKNHSLYRR